MKNYLEGDLLTLLFVFVGLRLTVARELDFLHFPLFAIRANFARQAFCFAVAKLNHLYFFHKYNPARSIPPSK